MSEDEKLNLLKASRNLERLRIFNNSIRHSLINKMTVIGGYTELLIFKFDSQSKEGKSLEAIRSSCEDINSLNVLSRKYNDMDLGPVWQSFLGGYKECRKPLSMKIIIGDGMNNINLYASPFIFMVWENLFDNAARHGGASEVKIYFQIDEQLVITFEDNGKGISLEEKERIFEKGFGKNTGMGLFLVKEILGDTGMQISEVGEPGKGAKFKIIVNKDAYKIE
ncbi:MAG: HAMP domain-containing sensor histidine kinase [Candidatus Paceibacterota bacterium]|jgi:signal transduction histidine kinase